MSAMSWGTAAGRRRVGRTRALLPLIVAAVLGLLSGTAVGEKSKKYQMSDVCKKYFLRDLYRKIDGAVLTSQNERDLDCAITFQTHSILQRFMLRFDQLQLDCNDHLYIYDGAHAVGSYKVVSRLSASKFIVPINVKNLIATHDSNYYNHGVYVYRKNLEPSCVKLRRLLCDPKFSDGGLVHHKCAPVYYLCL